ncbi:hypothetical protein, partial [Arachnia propionica]|uniref:hypothetical protein n=1 Tax=Arachnia propionica TaxID=1750 RepID=UPI001C8A09B4
MFAYPEDFSEWLEPRFIDGEKACGVRGVMIGQKTQNEYVNESWVLCRRDNCWAFRMTGKINSGRIPGELTAALDTVRFVPPVDPRADFRLGESDVSPS